MPKIPDLDEFYWKRTWLVRIITLILILTSPITLPVYLYLHLRTDIKRLVRDFYEGTVDIIFGKYK